MLHCRLITYTIKINLRFVYRLNNIFLMRSLYFVYIFPCRRTWTEKNFIGLAATFVTNHQNKVATMRQLFERSATWSYYFCIGSRLAYRLFSLFRMRCTTIALVFWKGRFTILPRRLLSTVRRCMPTMFNLYKWPSYDGRWYP